MTIRVRFFAVIRDKAGQASTEIDARDGATIATIISMLQETLPGIGPYIGRCAFAVNQEYVPVETVLHDGDELAVIPPVSGGSDL